MELMFCTALENQIFRFCSIKVLSVYSDHCRTMVYRIGVTVVLGEMDVAQVKPNQTVQGDPPVRKPSLHPPAWTDIQLPGGQSQPVCFPVDDVHQTQIT